MRLPSGYTTDHWAWSMSDPSFRATESTSLPWDELDDVFLFSAMPEKELSAHIEEFEDGFDAQIAASDDIDSIQSSSTTVESLQPGPVSRSSAHARSAKEQSQAPVANSVPMSMINSTRRMRQQEQTKRVQEAYREHEEPEVLALRRQVTDLTQRLTMMLANRCAACQLCLTKPETDSEAGNHRDMDPAEIARLEKDRTAMIEVEAKVDKLAIQAQLLSF